MWKPSSTDFLHECVVDVSRSVRWRFFEIGFEMMVVGEP
ncbi:hypothetical protein RK21_02027 [Pseudomonas plecoglossicida]|nr:hypothetical protein RK21_02027 [Pseudomonas plecoglossicida]